MPSSSSSCSSKLELERLLCCWLWLAVAKSSYPPDLSLPPKGLDGAPKFPLLCESSWVRAMACTLGSSSFQASSDFWLNSICRQHDSQPHLNTISLLRFTCRVTKLRMISFMSSAFWFLKVSNSVSRRSDTRSNSILAESVTS